MSGLGTMMAIHGPTDPELAPLWSLAHAKFLARTGEEPASVTDWNTVTREYAALTSKRHGAMSKMVREICPTPGSG